MGAKYELKKTENSLKNLNESELFYVLDDLLRMEVTLRITDKKTRVATINYLEYLIGKTIGHIKKLKREQYIKKPSL